MSVLSIERAVVEPPAWLPVTHLSVSSLNLFRKCPEQWRRRYLDHAYEPSTVKMVLGAAAGAALAQDFGAEIETGAGHGIEQVLDEFSAVWDERTGREEVDYEDSEPGAAKDSAVRALRLYHAAIRPTVVPVAIEREFELSWPGAPFTLTGYLDLETADNRVVDLKMTKASWPAAKIKATLQPDVYLAARQAEGDPADGFEYHLMVRTTQPKVPVMPAERTPQRLASLTSRVFNLARQIAWRTENDCWSGPSEELAWVCAGCKAPDCQWRLA